MRSILRLLWLFLAAVAATACGGEVVGGGFDGEVRTFATGDGNPPASSSLAPAAAEPTAAVAEQQIGIVPTGTISFDAAVTLVSQAGQEVPLTQGTTTAVVRIEGTDTALVAQQGVRAGSYTLVRVVFTRVTAEVTGGLVIGGVPLLGPVTVAIGTGGSVVVERPIQLTIEPLTSHSLLINLRASAWLPATNLLARTVPAAAFANAVEVRVR